MLTRIITGMCLVLVAVPVIFFSHTLALEVFVSLLSGIAVFEMMRCLGLHKNYYLSIPSYIVALAVPATVRMMGALESPGIVLFAVGYIYALFVLACAMFSQGKIRFKDAAKAFMSTAYIICGFTCLVATGGLAHGKFLIVMVLVVAFATDIFAYFSGMLFGRHKLIPAVSPKKTVEGAIGGTLISAASFVGCAYLYSHLYDGVTPHALPLFLCGAALSVVSQIGDLIASYIKRERDVKDYGKLFPGHGGVLDRFDSVIAVAPLLYIMLVNPSLLSIFN